MLRTALGRCSIYLHCPVLKQNHTIPSLTMSTTGSAWVWKLLDIEVRQCSPLQKEKKGHRVAPRGDIHAGSSTRALKTVVVHVFKTLNEKIVKMNEQMGNNCRETEYRTREKFWN